MTTTQTTPGSVFDPMVFRDVVGHFASGVTVITTNVDGELFGTTASAVSSLSMEPPMMLACLNRTSSTHDAVVRSGYFGINILAEDQGDLAMKFGRKGADKFDSVAVSYSEHGNVPMLDGALAHVVCRVDETPAGGTHTVFFGLVQEASAREGAEPLAYYRGTFGRLERVKELAAYDAVRDWVLHRRTPVGEALVPEQIAVEIRSDANNVHNALVKLSAEGLVSRGGDGQFAPTPMTEALINSAYEGRATIELGVLASHFEKITEADVVELCAMSEKLGQLRERGADSLDEFLKLNAKFHNRLVSIAGSVQLTDAFRRLGIGTVWRQALSGADWARQMDHSHVVALTDALRSRDAVKAAQAVREHTDFAKKLAGEVISGNGGAV